MILSDRDIRRQVTDERIVIEPFDPIAVQPASVDIRLGHGFRVFHNYTTGFIDPREDTSGLTEPVEPPAGEPFMLHPGQFVLGTTLETFRLPDDLVARLEGKSSLGRLGLVIHSTAGYIDPGFHGEVTLELSNVASLPIALIPGMWIGHLSFEQLSSPAENPYGSGALNSKYQGQVGPTASHSHENYQ